MLGSSGDTRGLSQGAKAAEGAYDWLPFGYAIMNSQHGRPQKFFQGRRNVDVLLILFTLLTIQ